MYSTVDLHREAVEALEHVWFIQSMQEVERTDHTLSVRLSILPGLFVQAFVGELSGSLYFALIEGGRRIYGIDRVGSDWHLHPHDAPDRHEPLLAGLEPKPLLGFLSRAEEVLLEHDLL